MACRHFVGRNVQHTPLPEAFRKSKNTATPIFCSFIALSIYSPSSEATFFLSSFRYLLEVTNPKAMIKRIPVRDTDTQSAFAGIPSSIDGMKGVKAKQQISGVAKKVPTTVAAAPKGLISSGLQAARRVYANPVLRKTSNEMAPRLSMSGLKPKIRLKQEKHEVWNVVEAKSIDEAITSQLPKTREFSEKIGLHAISIFHKKVQSSFKSILTRCSVLSPHQSLILLYRFMTDHINAMLSYSESVSLTIRGHHTLLYLPSLSQAFPMVPEVNSLQLASIHFQALIDSSPSRKSHQQANEDVVCHMKVWIQAFIDFSSILTVRETSISNLMQEFELLEEQSSLFRDVLNQVKFDDQATHQKQPIEIVIRKLSIHDHSGYLVRSPRRIKR
ncbi:hypothetical protein BC830DRAFT_751390 [Chytriomyces sp. MP71]|nr:hypothetical protein BC830DRAFT_751390 [Chytriomyces sp. MP71]